MLQSLIDHVLQSSGAVRWTVVALTVVYGEMLRRQGQPLSPELPKGILSLEMPRTVTRAKALVKDLVMAKKTGLATVQVLLDFAFIPLYCCSLLFAFDAVANAAGASYARWSALAGVVLFSAGALDVAENAVMLVMLSGRVRSPLPQLTTLFSASKFVLLGATLLAIVFAGLAALVQIKLAKQLYECNDYGGISRLAPGIILFVLWMVIWRWRSPPDSEPPGRSALQIVTFAIALVSVFAWVADAVGLLPAPGWSSEIPIGWFVCVLLLILWLAMTLRQHRAGIPESRYNWVPALAPALCAVGVTALIVGGARRQLS